MLLPKVTFSVPKTYTSIVLTEKILNYKNEKDHFNTN